MNARVLAGSNVVLILCGSFNPPTYLHLRMFERAKDFLQRVLIFNYNYFLQISRNLLFIIKKLCLYYG